MRPDAWMMGSPALGFQAVAIPDIELTHLAGDAHSLESWLITFPLLPVVLDPYTHESAWILDTARRILVTFTGADCRPCWIVKADPDDTKRFLGPYSDELLTFSDPEGKFASAYNLNRLPAFALIRQDGELVAEAQGWSPESWRLVTEKVTTLTGGWNRPVIPAPGDPAPFSGTPTGV